MARKRRSVSKGFVKVLMYVFTFIGIVATALGAYQYRQIRALYSLANVLSVSRRAEVVLTLDAKRLRNGSVTPGEVPGQARKAFGDLGVEAVVKTR